MGYGMLPGRPKKNPESTNHRKIEMGEEQASAAKADVKTGEYTLQELKRVLKNLKT